MQLEDRILATSALRVCIWALFPSQQTSLHLESTTLKSEIQSSFSRFRFSGTPVANGAAESQINLKFTLWHAIGLMII